MITTSKYYVFKKCLPLLSLLVGVLFSGQMLAQDTSSPIGQWKTIDDETGKPKSIIEIYDNNGELEGKIIELLNPSKPNPLCDKCEGERKNQAITGMVIIWGVTANEENTKWGGGKILDPKKGKIYKVKFSLKDNGGKLKVRGYIGAPLLGRTQVWERVSL
ncbi:MAG: DUF2147 domain-containing protein [Cellvibrionaceae bacterium]